MMRTCVKLFLLLFVFFGDANSQVFIVNGRSEQGSDVDGNGRSSSSDQRPFIVVAAASSSENDADPNEAFIPTNDDNDANRPSFKLLTQEDLQREEAEDFEVIEAGDETESSRTFIPTNDNLSSQPGFKLLSQEDLARAESQDDVIVVEVADDEEPRLLDIPRDTSGKDQPFFRLPLPDEAEEDEYDDVVIIAASDEGRSGFDNADSIPRDTSDFGSAPGFKLPLPEEAEEDEYSDVEIIEADYEGRTLNSDIPRDTSGFSGPGFKLPLPEEAEEDEYFDVEIIEADDEGRTLSDIPRDESAADEAGPRLPKKIDDYEDVEIISVGNEEVDCFEERDPGTCLNSHEAWFYDPTHNKCHFFIYSGCGGNSNRFFTEEECIGTCKDAKRTNKKKVVCPHAAPICQLGCVLGKEEEDNDEGTCLTCICNKKPALEKQDVSICLEPARTGLCKAALKYWYYNADRQACEEFTYGGCEAGSSPNKFHTKVLCQEACQGVKKE